MSLKQYYSSETEIPTELKNFYVSKNNRYELQVEGFESVPAVFTKNQELIQRQATDGAKIQELEAKAGQVNSLTQDLANKNTEISRLSSEVTQLQSKSVPGGYRAVTKADADLIEKLKADNLKPEDVLESLKKLPELQTKVLDYELEKSISAFAEVERIGNVKALTRLIKQDGVQPVVKEVEEGGKKVRKGYLVKTIDEAPVESPYAEYKTANWSEFTSALDNQAPPPKGNSYDPKPHNMTKDDVMQKEIQAQASTGRYTL